MPKALQVGMGNFWKNRKVFVTGAGGFIGSHLCDLLVEEGASVTALIKYSSSGHLGNLNFSKHLSEIKIVLGNIEDQELTHNLVQGHDTVFHLAALIGIPYSYSAVESYVNTNITGTYHVLNSCLRHSVRKAVITSTSECYGTAQYAPIDEKHPLQAQSPYAASKISADKLAESMHLSFKLPVATIRPFNTFGPRQSMRAVIPTILSQAIAHKKVKLGSLSPTRDFNYVSDTARGFLKVAQSEMTNGEVFNIGSGQEISIGEICDLSKEILGFDFSVEVDESRVRPEKSEVHRLIADSAKAKKVLGWNQEVSLKEGLLKTAQFIQENKSLYSAKGYAV